MGEYLTNAFAWVGGFGILAVSALYMYVQIKNHKDD